MKITTTAAAVLAAATTIAAGFAVAQPTSTPGNGCTATANAMRGGNFSTSPTLKDCEPAAPVAVVPVQPAVVAAPEPVPAPAPVVAEKPAPMPAQEQVAQAPVEPAPAVEPPPRADRN